MSDRDQNPPERTGRRTALKAIGASAVVGSGLLSAASPVAARAEAIPISPDEHEVPNPDLQVTKVDRSVKSVSSYFPILTLREDTVVSYINDSDLSRKERREARQALFDLRSKFPVVEERDGNTTWLTLADGAGSPDDDDVEKFKVAGRAYADGASGGSHGGPSTQHYRSLHVDMTEHACNEMGFSDSLSEEIASYADDPDDPDVDIGVPDDIPHSDTVEEGLEEAINKILHHYGQYLDTNMFETYHNDHHSEEFNIVGGARGAANIHMNYADMYCCSTENKYLGMATHYPQDMSVPLHTGMGWEQANLEIYYDWGSGSMEYRMDPLYWLHSEYEQFVSDEWWWFSYDFDSQCDGCYYYYPIDDVRESIYNMADYSGQYSYDVFSKIQEEGDVGHENWSSETRDYMYDITENCINECGHYTRGFIHEIKRD